MTDVSRRHPRLAVAIGCVALLAATVQGLSGPLRVSDGAYADAAGPRTVYFCSWFPALRIWRDDRAAATRELDAIAAAGWQGIRVFTAVGGWQPYWDGREVAPVTFRKQFEGGAPGDTVIGWPDYDDQLRSFLAAVRARGLRLHLTTGDAQMIFPEADAERAFHRRVAGLVREGGGADVVAVYEVWNEGWQNNALGASPAALEHARAILRDVKAVVPDVLTAISAAPGGPDGAEGAAWAEGADVAIVHGTRAPIDDALRDAFALVYREGSRRPLAKPFWQGEPTGPDGKRPEVFAPTNDPAWLLALYAVHLMTGQATVFFNGPAVRYSEPLGATWGFRELPPLLALVPRDVGGWPHLGDRHRADAPLTALQFRSGDATGPEDVVQAWNDRQVVAVVHGGRGPWELDARRSLARWRIVGPDGVEHEGTGGFPPLDADLRARLVIGEFAAR
jgi:hypothetical protein